MANIEEHRQHTVEQAGEAGFTEFPICAGPIIVRLEDVPATPRNLERIRERVRLLNLRLAASDTPFRVRVL